MAMVAIVALSLYSVMSIAFRARRSAIAQTDAAGRAMIAFDVVEQDLRSVVIPGPLDGPQLAGPFIGTTVGSDLAPASTVSFFTLGRDSLAASDVQVSGVSPFFDGMRQIELALDTRYDPPRLVRRIRRNLLTPTAFEVEEEPLLSNVNAFGVRYFDGTSWLAEWDSEQMGNVLPYALEITLELATPAEDDPDRTYRLTKIIPLPLARPVPAEAATTP